MKQYKLIKWYPSLPEDWEEGMLVGQGDSGYGNYAPCNSAYTGQWITGKIIENNPEFWKKEDEVLFTTDDGVDIHKGDMVYPIYHNYTMYGDGSPIMAKRSALAKGAVAVFSTKEKALEFIGDHKPQYSKKDMMDFCEYTLLKPNIPIEDISHHIDVYFKNY